MEEAEQDMEKGREETGWARASSGKQEVLKSVRNLGCAAKLPDILHSGRNRDIKLAEQIKMLPPLNGSI